MSSSTVETTPLEDGRAARGRSEKSGVPNGSREAAETAAASNDAGPATSRSDAPEDDEWTGTTGGEPDGQRATLLEVLDRRQNQVLADLDALNRAIDGLISQLQHARAA